MDTLRQLYEEIILDHNRHPRNYNYHPPHANRTARGYNPICGDDFTVYLTVSEGVIVDVGFEGHGCAISTASASLMTEAIKGKSEEETAALFENVHRMLTKEKSDISDSVLGKLRVLQGVREFPSRIKCATLAWHALNAALSRRQAVTTE